MQTLGAPAHLPKVAAANVLRNDNLEGLYDVQAICKPLLPQGIKSLYRILELQRGQRRAHRPCKHFQGVSGRQLQA